jgi:enoyl-CoA hydratase/carnithine racemase
MRCTPSIMRVSCSSTEANAGLLAATTVAGIAQSFCSRPNPAIIGICDGGMRTQPSRTTGAQSDAVAAADAASSANVESTMRMSMAAMIPAVLETGRRMGQLVETTVHDGGIHEIRLARAHVNALNPALCVALREAIMQAQADGARGIILSGGPKAFTAGLDVPHLITLDAAALRDAWEGFFLAARALAESPVPVVAALNGHAPAGGCVLALCCDYRVMAAGAYFIGLNETQVGLVAPEGIQQLMQRVVGAHRAERMLVAGEMVDAQRALEIGLVDELADLDAVPARAREWLAGLLALPGKPMLATRAIARADVVAALQPERIGIDRFIASWNDLDTQTALRALVARLGK